MPNFDFITPQMATGGDLPPHDEHALEALLEWRHLGITHILDNRLEWSDEEFVAQQAADIVYLHNGVDDAGQAMPDSWFDRGVAFITAAIQDPANKVHIHCHMGINRGPSLAYAALLALRWDPIDAIAAVRTARPIAGVGYAEDALDWHHRRLDTEPAARAQERARLAQWRREHPLDVVRIIRGIRAAEEDHSAA